MRLILLRVCVSQGSTLEPRTTVGEERGADVIAEAGRKVGAMVIG